MRNPSKIYEVCDWSICHFNLNVTYFNLNSTYFNLNVTYFNLNVTYFNLKVKRCIFLNKITDVHLHVMKGRI